MVLIVVPANGIDLLLRILKGCEPMEVQALVAEVPIERRDRRVVVRLATATGVFTAATISGIYVTRLLLNHFAVTSRSYITGVTAFLVCWLVLLLSKYFRVPRLLVYLGGASYSLYLTHPYIIQAIDKGTGWFSSSGLLAVLATVLSFASSILFASIVYSYFERPSRHYLREKLLPTGFSPKNQTQVEMPHPKGL